tara:strand:- start:880 stop:2871 length:1992 start_codon:yes stop_codon:yes gene_type:complete
MATKKVNIDIVARDKSRKALNDVRGSLDKLKSSVFNVRNALAGLGAGLVIRNLVNTGKELENLQTRFKFLLKDANEGAKAFQNISKFASQVPFSLEEIQAGSGILATVTDNADDLQNMLEITGNVAATTGLDFRTAAEQIQRSFSAGIGAADLFREKGVRNMLGFKAGATVSIEETVEAFENVFGKGGEFGKATDELANTFEGTLSMIGDKFFNFKRTILEAGFFPELKKQFGDLDNFLEENARAIDDIAIKIGQGLAQAVKSTAEVVKFLADNFEILKGILVTIITLKVAAFFHTLTTAILATNKALLSLNFNFGMLGRRLRFLTTAFALMNGQFGLMAQLEKRKETLKETARASVMLGEKVANLTKFQEENTESTDKNTKSVKEYKNALVDMFIEQARLEDRQFGMSDNDIANIRKHLSGIEDEKLKVFKSGHIDRVFEQDRMLDEQIGLELDALKEFEKIEKFKGDLFTEMMSKRHRKEQELIRENEEKKVALKKQAEQTIFSNTKSSLQALSGLNRTGFEAFKRFQIAEATINAISGAATAFKTFAGNPFMATFVAASHLAKGMALVAQIKSTNFREKGGPVSQGKPFIVGEKGPELFVPNQSGNIVANNKMGGSPVAVTFNINTVDARGFNELLTNSRGTIVSLINSAVNETGRQAVV